MINDIIVSISIHSSFLFHSKTRIIKFFKSYILNPNNMHNNIYSPHSLYHPMDMCWENLVRRPVNDSWK